MRSMVRALGPICLVTGLGLLGASLMTGGARLYLLFILPVVTGTSALFGLSVVLLVVGFLFLPFLFAGEEPSGPPSTPRAPATAGAVPGDPPSGGLIFVGPIPIFFGAWRRNPPIPYRWAVLVGVLLAALAVLLLWGFSALCHTPASRSAR